MFVICNCGFSQATAVDHEQAIRLFFQDVTKYRQSGRAPFFTPIIGATGTTYLLPRSATHFVKFAKPLRDRLQAMNENPKSADEALFLPILIRLQDEKGNIKTRVLPDGLSEVTVPSRWKK